MKQYLAIDIGGTAVKLGIVDEEMCIRDRGRGQALFVLLLKKHLVRRKST